MANSIAIIGVCGVHIPYSSDEDVALADEWLLADFVKLYRTWNDSPGVQIVNQKWLTSIDINKHCNQYGSLWHGPMDGTTHRRQVYAAHDEPFFTVVRRGKLLKEFRQAINIFFAEYDRVVIMITAHGERKEGGYIWIGGAKFRKTDLDLLVPSHVTNGVATILMSSCYGGLWLSDKWTLYTAAAPKKLSWSYRRSTSGCHRGGSWAGTLAEQLEEQGKDAKARDVCETAAERAREVDPINSKFSFCLAEWDRYGHVESVLLYDQLPKVVCRIPTEAASGVDVPSRAAGPSPLLSRLGKKFRITEEGQHLTSQGDGFQQKQRQLSRLDSLVQYHDAGRNAPPHCTTEIPVQLLFSSYRKGGASKNVCRALEEELTFRLNYDLKAIALLERLGVKVSLPVLVRWEPDFDWLESEYVDMLETWEEGTGCRPRYNKPLLFVAMMLETLKVEPAFVAKAVEESCGARMKRKRELSTTEIASFVCDIFKKEFL